MRPDPGTAQPHSLPRAQKVPKTPLPGALPSEAASGVLLGSQGRTLSMSPWAPEWGDIFIQIQSPSLHLVRTVKTESFLVLFGEHGSPLVT